MIVGDAAAIERIRPVLAAFATQTHPNLNRSASATQPSTERFPSAETEISRPGGGWLADRPGADATGRQANRITHPPMPCVAGFPPRLWCEHPSGGRLLLATGDPG